MSRFDKSRCRSKELVLHLGQPRPSGCRRIETEHHTETVFEAAGGAGDMPFTRNDGTGLIRTISGSRIRFDAWTQQGFCCWIGGHGSVPNEQSTQQSPAFGRSSSPQPVQS